LRLRRLAHKVIWVSPHAGRDGFAPVTAGLRAVLPHVDALVAGHSVAAFAELAQLLEGDDVPAAGRRDRWPATRPPSGAVEEDAVHA
jgi:hypothetical protein